MKKQVLTLLMVGLLCMFISSANANMVTVTIGDLVANGHNELRSMQLDFVPLNPGDELPFDWDVALTYGPAIGYDSKSKNGVTMGTLLNGDYARGAAIAQFYADKPFHDGLLLTIESFVTDIAVPLDSILIFASSNTAVPISGLYISSEWIGTDQVITISADGPDPVVPIPATVVLFGGGLLGLFGLRRRG